MLRIKYHNRPTYIKTKWKELTLHEGKALLAIAKKLPGSIQELYRLKTLKEEGNAKREKQLLKQIKKEDEVKNLPLLYRQMIKIVSGLTDKELRHMWPGEIASLYYQYVMKFAVGLLVIPTYRAEGIRSFKHKGERYYLPASAEILDQNIPGVELTALEFTEVADLQLAADYPLENAEKIIAILCRPQRDGKIEAYNEQRCMKRAQSFESLPMSVVWEVFFCSARWSHIFAQYTQISSLEKQLEAKKARRSPTAGTPRWWKFLSTEAWARSSKRNKQKHTTT